MSTVRQPRPPSEIAMLWSRRSHVGPLGDGEVHVWAAGLGVPRDRLERLAETLSPDERHRAARFQTAEHSRRWIVGRGLLREILGEYLQVQPEQVCLSSDAHGKLVLAGPPPPPISFCLTRSGGLAVFAISSDYEVGVDAEEIREFPEMRAMADRLFSHAERVTLAAVSPGAYLPAFYRCWTRKEAYLKARGTGLLEPLDGFDVEIASDRPAALLRVAGEPAAPGQWTMIHLEPAGGYVGALAVGAPPAQVSWDTGCWEGESRVGPLARPAGLPS